MNQAIAEIYELRKRLDGYDFPKRQDGSLCMHSISIDDNSTAIVSTNQYGDNLDERIQITFLEPNVEAEYKLNAFDSFNRGPNSFVAALVPGALTTYCVMMLSPEYYSSKMSLIYGVISGVITTISMSLLFYKGAKKSREFIEQFETITGEPALEQLEELISPKSL